MEPVPFGFGNRAQIQVFLLIQWTQFSAFLPLPLPHRFVYFYQVRRATSRPLSTGESRPWFGLLRVRSKRLTKPYVWPGVPASLSCNTIQLSSGTTDAKPKEVQNHLFLWFEVKPEIRCTDSCVIPAPLLSPSWGQKEEEGGMVTDIHIEHLLNTIQRAISSIYYNLYYGS